MRFIRSFFIFVGVVIGAICLAVICTSFFFVERKYKIAKLMAEQEKENIPTV